MFGIHIYMPKQFIQCSLSNNYVSIKGNSMLQKHFAVKCNYNNGGEDDLVGFAGTCTEEIIKGNVTTRVWCSDDSCECKKYYKLGFKGNKPIRPCMESTLFRDWVFGAGWFHNGSKAGEPKRANITKGGIALLTTRFPEEIENERKIVGLYKISNVTNNKNEETRFYADTKLKLRLPLEESRQLYLWDYYTINSKLPKWGTGLIRYLNNAQVKKILEDLSETVQSNSHREILNNLLTDFHDVDSSSVRGLRKTNIDRTISVLLKRKYGPGGEGENHKRLKKWVAEHPQSINLNDIKNHEIEYPFCSGDVVDLLFERKNGFDVVVEIETEIPLPGAHQAIKYRALRCAEKCLELSSNKVKAVLVAWKIPEEVKRFCMKYNIETFEIKK